MDDFMVCYSENVNFVIMEMVCEFFWFAFFLIVRTFFTDIVQSFLKFSSLSFPLFLFLSVIFLPDGFKDLTSLILPSTVV